MGREWLYKGSSGGDGSRGGGRSPSATSTAAKSMNRKSRKEKNASSSSGCMSAIFNLFDIQHHQFRFHHPSFISESTIIDHQESNFCFQGVEAPRNSLESPESAMDVAPSSTKVKEQTNLNIPMVGIQVKTKRSRFTDDVSSECSSSPGTKTPNLVARLMGLDLLPEYSSPRPSASSTPANSHHRSRSLPATPRSSTTSRRSTDNDYHHRLSLQIDKENCNRCRGQEHESLQMKMARRRSELMVNRQDDDRDQYAKQITNQVRERISRRLGTDITNTISPTTRSKEHRRDSNLVLLKPKKPSNPPQAPPPSPAPETSVKAKKDDSTPFSSSRKLRLLDFKNNLNKPTSNSRSSSLKEAASTPETLPGHRKPLMKQEKPVKDEKLKRIASERYDLRFKKMNQQEDYAFINKKKSTSLPNHVVNVKNTTKFRSFKKEMTSSSSTTRLPQKQVYLPSCLNSSYNAKDTQTLDTTTTTTTTTVNGGSFSDHSDYISRILKHCGIEATSPISACHWYTPSHPLPPLTFHQLETPRHPTTTSTSTATPTATRRLIFELVNELLVEILKPYMNQKPWVCPRPPDSCVMRGSELIGRLCEGIGSFPAVNCEVLEDIDGLIERDIGRSMRRQWTAAFEAEAEDIVKEIESEMVETLVHEMAIPVTVAPAGSDRVKSHVMFT